MAEETILKQTTSLRSPDSFSSNHSSPSNKSSPAPRSPGENGSPGPDEPPYKISKLHQHSSPSLSLNNNNGTDNVHVKIEPESFENMSETGQLNIPHSVLGKEGVSAFTKTNPSLSEQELSPSQKQLSLIKLSQIKSAFNTRPPQAKSIGQMFALKKRIKLAQLNGDSSLTSHDGHLVQELISEVKVKVKEEPDDEEDSPKDKDGKPKKVTNTFQGLLS